MTHCNIYKVISLIFYYVFIYFKLSVTGAWAKDLKAEGKVRILADPAGSYAKVNN